MASEKEKALELAINRIEKQFGKGSIMKLGDLSARMAAEAIPTGSLGFDFAFWVGGVSRGGVSEIFWGGGFG